MKKIEAFVRIRKLEDVRHAVLECGIEGMTVTDVHGYGQEQPTTETYRGVEQSVDSKPRVKIEVVVAANQTERVVHAILESAFTGHVGDGLILVTELTSVVSIRTGETLVPSLV